MVPRSINVSTRRCSRFVGAEALSHFTLRDLFAVAPAAEVAHSRAPECHSRFIRQELADFPASGESLKDELGGFAAYTKAAFLRRNKKFRHSKIASRRLQTSRATDQCKTNRSVVLENDERMRRVIREEARNEFFAPFAK